MTWVPFTALILTLLVGWQEGIWPAETSINCCWWNHVTRCITANVLQTKMDAQDKLVTELSWKCLRSTFSTYSECRKSPILTYPSCNLAPLQHQKTTAPGLSCGVVCVILRLAISVEHQLVTGKRTWLWHIPHSLAWQWMVKTSANYPKRSEQMEENKEVEWLTMKKAISTVVCDITTQTDFSISHNRTYPAYDAGHPKINVMAKSSIVLQQKIPLRGTASSPFTVHTTQYSDRSCGKSTTLLIMSITQYSAMPS